jgi:hypothetical protein
VALAFLGAALYGITIAAKIGLGDNVELWALCLAAVVALSLGGLTGLLWTRSRTSDGDDREEIDELQNLKTYTAHFMNTLGCFLSNELSLTELFAGDSEEIAQAICELPAQLISQARNCNVKISLWAEKQDAGGSHKFEIVFDGDHSGKEVRKFNAICVEHSWMHHRRESHQGSSPIQVMNLADRADGNQDIQAFRGMEYRDGRAVWSRYKWPAIPSCSAIQARGGVF